MLLFHSFPWTVKVVRLILVFRSTKEDKNKDRESCCWLQWSDPCLQLSKHFSWVFMKISFLVKIDPQIHGLWYVSKFLFSILSHLSRYCILLLEQGDFVFYRFAKFQSLVWIDTFWIFPGKTSTSCSDEVLYSTFHTCSPQSICTVWFYKSISRQGDLKRHFSFMSMLFSGEPHSPKSYPLLSNFTFIHSVVNYRDQSCSICFVLYYIHLYHVKWYFLGKMVFFRKNGIF